MELPAVTTMNTGVTTLKFDAKGGWKQAFLLMSDVHYDSISCRREVLKRHLEYARERGAFVLDIGDFFDAMQGRFDPRRDMEAVRKEYRRNDYYDAILQDALTFLAPYAEQYLFLARGNHEIAVLKNANTDLTERLACGLRERGGVTAVGDYAGWVRIVVREGQYRRGAVSIMYRHGLGAGAPVTRGVIETNRQAVYVGGVDLVWNGHNHQGYLLPISRDRMLPSGRVQPVLVWFVRTPGYKDEWHQERSGYIARKGHGPTPIGAIWLDVKLSNHRLTWNVSPLMEA